MAAEAWMAGASVTKTAQLASASTGTLTKVTSAFRSMGSTSINRVTAADSVRLMTVMLVH